MPCMGHARKLVVPPWAPSTTFKWAEKHHHYMQIQDLRPGKGERWALPRAWILGLTQSPLPLTARSLYSAQRWSHGSEEPPPNDDRFRQSHTV